MGDVFEDPQRLVNGWKKKVNEMIDQSRNVRAAPVGYGHHDSRYGMAAAPPPPGHYSRGSALPPPPPPPPSALPLPPVPLPSSQLPPAPLGSGRQGLDYGFPSLRVGDRCEVPWGHGQYREASVMEVSPHGYVVVQFYPYGETSQFPISAVRRLH